MFCKNCGTELSEQAKFCPKCGAATGELVQDLPKKQKKTGKTIVKVVLGLLVVLTVTGIFLVQILGKEKMRNAENANYPQKKQHIEFFETEDETYNFYIGGELLMSKKKNSEEEWWYPTISESMSGEQAAMLVGSNGELYFVNEKNPILIADNIKDCKISTEGKGIVYTDWSGGLWLYNADTDQSEKITETIMMEEIKYFSVSPDGGTVIYSITSEEICDAYCYSSGKMVFMGNELLPLGTADNGKYIYLYQPNQGKIFVGSFDGEIKEIPGVEWRKNENELASKGWISERCFFNRKLTEIVFLTGTECYFWEYGKEARKLGSCKSWKDAGDYREGNYLWSIGPMNGQYCGDGLDIARYEEYLWYEGYDRLSRDYYTGMLPQEKFTSTIFDMNSSLYFENEKGLFEDIDSANSAVGIDEEGKTWEIPGVSPGYVSENGKWMFYFDDIQNDSKGELYCIETEKAKDLKKEGIRISPDGWKVKNSVSSADGNTVYYCVHDEEKNIFVYMQKRKWKKGKWSEPVKLETSFVEGLYGQSLLTMRMLSNDSFIFGGYQSEDAVSFYIYEDGNLRSISYVVNYGGRDVYCVQNEKYYIMDLNGECRLLEGQ